MAADPQDAISLVEALKFLAPLVGGGGITAIAVAYFGSKRPKPAEKPEPAAGVGIQALLADHLAMERFTTEVRRLADGIEDLVKVANRLGDMMDISAALERIKRSNDH